jgi:hypothetical protein
VSNGTGKAVLLAAPVAVGYIRLYSQAVPRGWPLLFLDLHRAMIAELHSRLDEYRNRLEELRRFL